MEGDRPPIRFHEEVSYLGGPCDVYSRPGHDQEEIERVPTPGPGAASSRVGPRGRDPQLTLRERGRDHTSVLGNAYSRPRDRGMETYPRPQMRIEGYPYPPAYPLGETVNSTRSPHE
eukprot:7495890-Heterocapsa_arctica.AAC.1